MCENNQPVFHILVVGFHHKMGCQVEFSHPPLIPGSQGKNECPSGWKYLPTLAMPDGSHNYEEDTVFFNLPSLTEPTGSIYGVSCYRQIPVEKLKIRTSDMTRSTVQKAVCCLLRLPLYGYIEVKLSLIADAFFDQGDFSQTELLKKAYRQLNDCFCDDESSQVRRQFYVGLSLREIILHWRHKMLQLFKLFLLQKRVVCFASPVRGMCVLILGITSLIPRLFEKGFQEVACVRTSRPLSPMPDYSEAIKEIANEANKSPKHLKLKPHLPNQSNFNNVLLDSHAGNCLEIASELGFNETCTVITPSMENVVEDNLEMDSNDVDNIMQRSNSFLIRETSGEPMPSTLSTLASVNPDLYRAPISIFASGNLCLPYLSLPYMDLLTDPSVLSYIIGTSNVLFQQKQYLSDVLIDIENATINVHNSELKRQLILTTEDLRFMDYLLRHVQSPKEDAEGSEVWIREQFQGYILALLRNAITTHNLVATKDVDSFNGHYLQAFKKTQCFQEWYDVRPDMEFFDLLPIGHPFAGNLSVSDMKLKITQTMQNSESGRKINQAVNTTSRAVGGAISQARDVFSNWWSSISTAQTIPATQMNTLTLLNAEVPSRNQSIPIIGERHIEVSEVSLSCHNKSDGIDVEMGVTVQYKTNDNKSMELSNDNSLDSAEEFKEDKESSSPVLINNGDGGDDKVKKTRTLIEGVVEIGKEAELLNSSTRDNYQKPIIIARNVSATITPTVATPSDSNVYIV